MPFDSEYMLATFRKTLEHIIADYPNASIGYKFSSFCHGATDFAMVAAEQSLGTFEERLEFARRVDIIRAEVFSVPLAKLFLAEDVKRMLCNKNALSRVKP